MRRRLPSGSATAIVSKQLCNDIILASSTLTKCARFLGSAERRAAHLLEPRLERLLTFRVAGHHRGADGILAGEFDGAFAHRGGAAARRSGEWVLEDVFDRDSAGRDSDAADLFPRAHWEIVGDLSARRERRADSADASARTGYRCFCGHGDSLVFAYQDHRQEPREFTGDRVRTADRRDLD